MAVKLRILSFLFIMIAADDQRQSYHEWHPRALVFREACDLYVGARPAVTQLVYHGSCHTGSSAAHRANEFVQALAFCTKVGRQ